MRDASLILRHLGAVVALHAKVVQAQLRACDELFAPQRALASSGAEAFDAFACCMSHATALEADVGALVAELGDVHELARKKDQN